MKRGFTLVELMVVLVVIAAVTHLAVRELGKVRDMQLVRRADRQLEDVRQAAIAFLEDVGRPLVATNGTLSELWLRPAGVREFAILPATANNLFSGAPADLKDAKVLVPVGWRGPYLRLPTGKSQLRDPWGNAFAVLDEAQICRVGVTNGIFAASVSHLGPDSLEADRRSVSLFPDRGGSASLWVKVVSAGGATAMPSAIDYRWYGPAGNVITGAVAKSVLCGTYAEFAGLTPGRRIIWDSVSGSSREVRIEAGKVNMMEIKLP